MATTYTSIIAKSARRLDVEHPGWAYRVHIKDVPSGTSRIQMRFSELWKQAIRDRRGRSGTRGRGWAAQ